ncbi:hypothetical protein ART_1186 [Arthrobacter sp. PAMC 25486]|nr:hypothetical protein ART_1186 [Arthrobacter sp. PAMC 25486]
MGDETGAGDAGQKLRSAAVPHTRRSRRPGPELSAPHHNPDPTIAT